MILLTLITQIFISQGTYAVGPCGRWLNLDAGSSAPIPNGGYNGHGRLKAETIGTNILLKRLQKIPTLDKEPVFKMSSQNVLSAVGEISLQQNENWVTVSLKINDLGETKNELFSVVGDYNNDDGVFYRLDSMDLEIRYYPDSMRLILQSKKESQMTQEFRLNHSKRNY